MAPSLYPSTVTAYEHQYPLSTDEEVEDGEFEFRPLLPQPRSVRIERPRTGRRVAANACNVTQRARRAPNVSAAAKAEQTPPPPRRVRWHHMAFGSVRVPSAMDMGEIKRRLKARQALAGSANEPSAAVAAGWAPWRLIRSLTCRGVEAVAVAAVAAPVRLV